MPNLPYFVDGDFHLTETDAIARYLADRSDQKDLLGKCPKSRARVAQVWSSLNEQFSFAYMFENLNI